MQRTIPATARTALIGLLVCSADFVSAATNPPAYSGPMTIAGCYNQTNGQLRLVKPWEPAGCIPPAPYQADPDSGATQPCSGGGAFDCRTSEYFLEMNTVGPQGPMGPPGAKGDRGDAGPAGADGSSVSALPFSTIDPRCDFRGGYEVLALDPASGATASLGVVCNGAKGDPGEKGETGATGSQGIAGAEGPQGEPGPAGPSGPTGSAGAPGPAGAPGTCALPVCATGDVLVSTGPGVWDCNRLCQGTLVDTRIDAANCGGCAHACAAGESCALGACVPPPPPPDPCADGSCPPPPDPCTGACASTCGPVLAQMLQAHLSSSVCIPPMTATFTGGDFEACSTSTCAGSPGCPASVVWGPLAFDVATSTATLTASLALSAPVQGSFGFLDVSCTVGVAASGTGTAVVSLTIADGVVTATPTSASFSLADMDITGCSVYGAFADLMLPFFESSLESLAADQLLGAGLTASAPCAF